MKASTIFRGLCRVRYDKRGATVVEYGLLLAFIALVMIVGLSQTGVSLQGVFKLMSDHLDSATG